MKNQTIAAVATPVGSGGIGIIRISGDRALPIAETVFRASKPQNPIASHRLYHGYVVDPTTGCTLDEVLLTVMKKPHSYTREDVVEIQTHSGSVVLSATLELVIGAGARLAEPGEFTKRAFLNGRIDLTQAEAVIDIITAKTEQSLRIAAAQIKGNLRKAIESARKDLVQLRAVMEAAVDFPDETEEILESGNIGGQLADRVAVALERLVAQHRTGHLMRDGIKVLIVGRPNVGKSSLLNRFIEKDRAIVTPMPGTTRDFLEETINFNGLPATIIDTAGLQKTEDPVELIGMEKTRAHMESADLILFLVEADRPLISEDHRIYEQVYQKPVILVLNKSDLETDARRVTLPDRWREKAQVKTSALYGQGISQLRQEIVKTVLGEAPIVGGDSIVPNLRHTIALEKALAAVQKTIGTFETGLEPELASIDLQEAIDSIDDILGINTKSDVLTAVFSQFCIGK